MPRTNFRPFTCGNPSFRTQNPDQRGAPVWVRCPQAGTDPFLSISASLSQALLAKEKWLRSRAESEVPSVQEEEEEGITGTLGRRTDEVKAGGGGASLKHKTL